jgi:hypothetical protein
VTAAELRAQLARFDDDARVLMEVGGGDTMEVREVLVVHVAHDDDGSFVTKESAETLAAWARNMRPTSEIVTDEHPAALLSPWEDA